MSMCQIIPIYLNENKNYGQVTVVTVDSGTGSSSGLMILRDMETICMTWGERRNHANISTIVLLGLPLSPRFLAITFVCIEVHG